MHIKNNKIIILILEFTEIRPNANSDAICEGNIYYIVRIKQYYKINNCKFSKIKILLYYAQ